MSANYFVPQPPTGASPLDPTSPPDHLGYSPQMKIQGAAAAAQLPI